MSLSPLRDLPPSPYRDAAAILLRESGCTVRKWRKANTGYAFTHDDDWGIEAPEPRGPVSFSVFAHEVAHQLLHRGNSTPRWLEEIEAWVWALDQFDRFSLPGKERALGSARGGVEYALRKALRRARRPETVAAIKETARRWMLAA